MVTHKDTTGALNTSNGNQRILDTSKDTSSDTPQETIAMENSKENLIIPSKTGCDGDLIENEAAGNEMEAATSAEEGRLAKLQKWIFPMGYCVEFKSIFYLAWSLFLTELFQFMFSLVAVAFCGRLGKIELDGVAMATSLLNVTGLSIMVGLSSACDTLFSQLYGSPHKERIGVALQRSIVIMLFFLLPCWSIHMNAEGFLVAIGQDPDVARLAGQYLLIFMPGLLCYTVYVPMTKYLQNQNIVIPNLVIGFTANLVNALCHYVFIIVLELGTNGSALSQVIGYFTMLVLTFLYIVCSKAYVGTWSGWSKDCLHDWGTFGQLSVFGLLMICIEWWTFEISVIVSGLLGTTELGAQSIVFQTSSLCYMVPLGLGMGSSIRVGQFLGGGQPLHAKNATREIGRASCRERV